MTVLQLFVQFHLYTQSLFPCIQLSVVTLGYTKMAVIEGVPALRVAIPLCTEFAGAPILKDREVKGDGVLHPCYLLSTVMSLTSA